MILVCRAILALMVDLLVCYLWGEAVLGNFYKRICHPFTNLLVGFLLGQGVFQIITLVCYFAGWGLNQVILLWGICTSIMCIWGVYTRVKSGRAKADVATGGNKTDATGQECPSMISKMDAGVVVAAVLAGVTVLAFCYYVCINGELNEDSRYYVGLVNVTMNTGTLFQYNAYNGVPGEAWYLRRALATYEIHSAMIGKAFHIPAILVTRYMRAWEDVILSSAAVYLFGSRILWGKKDGKKPYYLVVLFLLFQLVYSRSYSSSATFFLIRAYEGKAIVANVLVLVTLYLCAEYIRSRDRRMLLLLGLVLWGATAVSSSGMVVIAAELGIVLGAAALQQICRKRGAR